MAATDAAGGSGTKRPVARRQERRQGILSLMSGLAGALRGPGEVGQLRARLESELRLWLPCRALALRQETVNWSGLKPGQRPGIVSLEVPVTEEGLRTFLDMEPGAVIGDWERQQFAAAGQLSALVLEIERLRAQVARMGLPVPTRSRVAPLGIPVLIGSAMPMVALRQAVARVAATDFTVLIEGESGVGKELVARQVHELSRRRGGPFVAINCAALVETLLEAELFGIEERTATGVRGRRGKFEHADGGTLFLDEVGDLSPSAQAKLLRALQDLAVERVGGQGVQRVDIRVIAATNRGLSQLVERNLFRADLYYRLSGVDIRVPPLRERRDDVVELAEHFFARHRATRRLRLSPAAADVLTCHDWPGNVRELERLVERTVALAVHEEVDVCDLPPTLHGDGAAAVTPALLSNDTLRAWGSRYTRLVLERCRGNKREACRVLDISYHTLQSYLRHQPPRAVPGRRWLPERVVDGARRAEAGGVQSQGLA